MDLASHGRPWLEELNAATRHEYVGGVVHAVAGGSNAYAGRTASVPLPEIGCELPLAEVYDGLPDDAASRA